MPTSSFQTWCPISKTLIKSFVDILENHSLTRYIFLSFPSFLKLSVKLVSMTSLGQSFLLSYPFIQMDLKLSWSPDFHLAHHGSPHFIFLSLIDQTQSMLCYLPSHAKFTILSHITNSSAPPPFANRSKIGILSCLGQVQTSPNCLSPLSHAISSFSTGPPLPYMQKQLH